MSHRPIIIPSQPRFSRVGVCVNLRRCLAHIGVAPDAFLASHGLNPDLYDDVENHVPFSKHAEILADAARVTQCETFGVMLGLSDGLNALGNLGSEMRKAPTVGAALDLCQKSFLSVQERGATLQLMSRGEEAVLYYVIIDPEVETGEQLCDIAMAFACRMMGDLCGPGWTPRLVELPRRPPQDAGRYKTLFNSRISFNAPFAALHFHSRWLKEPPYLRDQSAPAAIARLPDELIVERVTTACVRRFLSDEEVTSDAVAHDIGTSRRTLHRKLAAHGTGFHAVLQNARFSSALRLIQDTDMSITQIAIWLGYSEISAFTRAFHSWSGYPPSRCRKTMQRPKRANIAHIS